MLQNISWSFYEQLLAAHEDKSSLRFVYDRGELEITVLSYEHEELLAALNRSGASHVVATLPGRSAGALAG
jgi:hypothetical protein